MIQHAELSPDQVREYLEPLLRACSRTAGRGVLDTSAAPGKAALVVQRDEAGVMRQHLDNSRNVCAIIAESLSLAPGTATSWQALVGAVNTQFTTGLTTTAGAYRCHDTPAAQQQLSPPAVAEYLQHACGIIARHDGMILSGEVSRSWGVGVAAFTIWAINIYGHVFADGCGRTSLSVATLLLLRYGLPVPLLVSPAAMYRGCYGEGGQLLWSRWYRYFQGVMPDGHRAGARAGRPAEPVDRPG